MKFNKIIATGLAALLLAQPVLAKPHKKKHSNHTTLPRLPKHETSTKVLEETIQRYLGDSVANIEALMGNYHPEMNYDKVNKDMYLSLEGLEMKKYLTEHAIDGDVSVNITGNVNYSLRLNEMACIWKGEERYGENTNTLMCVGVSGVFELDDLMNTEIKPGTDANQKAYLGAKLAQLATTRLKAMDEKWKAKPWATPKGNDLKLNEQGELIVSDEYASSCTSVMSALLDLKVKFRQVQGNNVDTEHFGCRVNYKGAEVVGYDNVMRLVKENYRLE